MSAQKVRIISSGPSNGARALVDTLNEQGVPASKVINGLTKKQPRYNIKWGCFGIEGDYNGPVLNAAASDVGLNKLTCFQALQVASVPIPEFTTDKAVAEGWGAKRIYERHKLRGSEGEGIVVVEEGGTLGDAPLYVKGLFGKRREYRIHVFNAGGQEQMFVQQKRRRVSNVEATTDESRIRNLANGWIFAHQDIVQPSEATKAAATAAIRALGLDFGAVDLIEMDKGGNPFVLEINCAPGLQGATLFFYADAIKNVLNPVVETEEEEF